MADSLAQSLQELIEAAKHDKALYQEIAATGAFDKPGYDARMKECHDRNAKLLEDFLARYGWPLPDVHGVEAHEAARLIAIHAIAHPALIKKVALMLKQAWQEGKIAGHYYANFYDRIALYEGRKQRYGTHLFPSPRGWQVCALEYPAKVDAYRVQMGMPTLAQWIEEAGEDGSGFSDYDQDAYDKEFVQWCYDTGWRKK